MSTTTQRPTPETDAAQRKCLAAFCVDSDFARNLERERDEARTQADNFAKRLEAMREAIREAWIEIQYAEAGFAGLALRVCPNDSAVESVLNRMTEALAKLQPLLKP